MTDYKGLSELDHLTGKLAGHVIDELEDAPQMDAEAAIRAAREAHVPVPYPPVLEGQL